MFYRIETGQAEVAARHRKACEARCASDPGCQAIDYYNETRWCSLYSQPCSQPTASWQGASSYEIAVACNLHNGSTGVEVAGRCLTGVELPTLWSVWGRGSIVVVGDGVDRAQPPKAGPSELRSGRPAALGCVYGARLGGAIVADKHRDAEVLRWRCPLWWRT